MRDRGAETLEGGRTSPGTRTGGCTKEKDEHPCRHPRAGPSVCGEHRRPHLAVECPRLDRRDGHRNRAPACRVLPGARLNRRVTRKVPRQLRPASDYSCRVTTERRTAFPAFDVGRGRLWNSSEKSSSPLAPSRYEVTCLPSRS